MLCFANGGKTRSEYCAKYCGGDWGEFSRICEGGVGGEGGGGGKEGRGRWNLVVETTEITPVSEATKFANVYETWPNVMNNSSLDLLH